MEVSGSPAPSAAPAASTATPSSAPSPASNAAPAPQSTRPDSTPAPANSKFGSSDAPLTPESKPETAAEKKARLIKAKVNGKELEYNLDEMPDEDLAYRLQMAEAARQKMSEAAALKKQFQEIVEGIKKDPFKMLQDPVFGGVDLKALAEKRLAEEYRKQTLPEHERKALEAEERVKQYEQKLKAYEEQERSRKQAEIDRQAEAELKTLFKTALTSGGLPVNDTTMYLLAEEADIADRDGIQLSPQQLAHRVKEKLRGFAKHSYSGLKGEQLANELGPDVVKEILRYSVERVKGKSQPAAQSQPPKIQKAPDLEDAEAPKRKYRDPDEIRRQWLWE